MTSPIASHDNIRQLMNLHDVEGSSPNRSSTIMTVAYPKRLGTSRYRHKEDEAPLASFAFQRPSKSMPTRTTTQKHKQEAPLVLPRDLQTNSDDTISRNTTKDQSYTTQRTSDDSPNGSQTMCFAGVQFSLTKEPRISNVRHTLVLCKFQEKSEFQLVLNDANCCIPEVLPMTVIERVQLRTLQRLCGMPSLYAAYYLKPEHIKASLVETFHEIKDNNLKCNVALSFAISEAIQINANYPPKKALRRRRNSQFYLPVLSSIAKHIDNDSSTEHTNDCSLSPALQCENEDWDSRLHKWLFRSAAYHKDLASTHHDSLSIDYDDASLTHDENFLGPMSTDSQSITLDDIIHIENDESLDPSVYQNQKLTGPEASLLDTTEKFIKIVNKHMKHETFCENDTLHGEGNILTPSQFEFFLVRHLYKSKEHSQLNSPTLKTTLPMIESRLLLLQCAARMPLKPNNLFQAASMSLYNTSELHCWVRHNVVVHMSNKRDQYRQYFPSTKYFIRYLHDMCNDNTCGDALTLKAIADCFSCSLHIITPGEKHWYLNYTPHNSRGDPLMPQRHMFLYHCPPLYYNTFEFLTSLT